MKCREENGFVPTAEDLEAAVTEKSKILILTYPNNPTGGIADRAALEKIASFAEKHDLLVISDEIYAELTYGQKHVSFASLPRMKERTAYVGGFSKAFAMTGGGWATSARPPQSTRRFSKFISILSSAPRSPPNTRPSRP